MSNQRPIILLVVLIIVVVLAVGALWWIKSQGENGSVNTNTALAINLTSFKAMAQQANCADMRNDLYVIDNQMVFWAKEGACPDASYSYILYGKNTQSIFCTRGDSIAGPMMHCYNTSYQSIFQTIVNNKSKKDLGLGPSHTVQQFSLVVNANANTNSNTIDAAYIRNKYCDKTYSDNPSLVKEITDCERGYRLEREDKSCVIINSQDQLECSDCGPASCSVDLGACVGTNSCWYISNTNTNTNINTEISSKSCNQDSDCGLSICSGCFAKESLKNNPVADLPCAVYNGYTCQCVKNRCIEVKPDKPYDFYSITNEADCLALGAEWVSVGKMMHCEMPAPDAGKTCTKASDCIRYCSQKNVNDATGTCSAYSGTSCYRFFNENGKLDGVCID